uniref:RING-type domain-containing protein n=1 Tax=Kalanchoe fedtschenkoi TaxID=63787 RepID=A0A7N0US76_KALFE
MASLYAFGWVMSSKLQESTQLPAPTLQIHSTLVTTLEDSTILHPTPASNMPKSFIVPLDFLETRKECEQWIRRNLLESMRFVIVASENDDPEKRLRWSMKNAWEARVKCSGVVEMNVMLVSTLDLRLIVVKSWLKTSVSNFTEGDEEEEGSRSCCCVCLDELEEKSAVVKLRCRHVYHSQCIRDWPHRKTTCPICRNPLDIRFKFWVHMDKKSSFLIQLQSEVQKHLFHTSTEVL